MNTVVTSARPIISADAVFAVRSGLRTALAWASGRSRGTAARSGRPSVPGERTATTGLSWATPMNTATAPKPSSACRDHGRVGDPRAPPRPARLRSTVSAAPDHGPARPGGGRRVEPLPHALHRWHRRGSPAGVIDAISVTPRPTTTPRRRGCGSPGPGPGPEGRTRPLEESLEHDGDDETEPDAHHGRQHSHDEGLDHHSRGDLGVACLRGSAAGRAVGSVARRRSRRCC